MGAEGADEFRDQGLTKWLGITGRTNSSKNTIEALRRFDFDTVMFPLTLQCIKIPQNRKMPSNDSICNEKTLETKH
ncbi:MAG: hypothetical protein CM1200mP3_13270 [Chloroflexota bacterium]|nr:MAG: hypothetical protein CM1200mP3_13270 [Chloroflexota bacterium]